MLAVLLSIITGSFAITYWGFEKIKRPIKRKTVLWHFSLLTIGLLLLAIASYSSTQIASADTQIHSSVIFFFIAIIFITTSTIIFIYGMIKAIFNNPSSNKTLS